MLIKIKKRTAKEPQESVKFVNYWKKKTLKVWKTQNKHMWMSDGQTLPFIIVSLNAHTWFLLWIHSFYCINPTRRLFKKVLLAQNCKCACRNYLRNKQRVRTWRATKGSWGRSEVKTDEGGIGHVRARGLNEVMIIPLGLFNETVRVSPSAGARAATSAARGILLKVLLVEMDIWLLHPTAVVSQLAGASPCGYYSCPKPSVSSIANMSFSFSCS